MNAPKRIQRRRNKGWRKPDGAIYVGPGSRWGNPARIGIARDPETLKPVGWSVYNPDTYQYGSTHREQVEARAEAVSHYQVWLTQRPAWTDAARRELAGRDLMCWCPEDQPCHVDVLLDVAGGGPS